MAEIVPVKNIKVVTSSEKEGLMAFQRIKDTIFFTGLENYLRGV
jgi:hypothetical protein